MVDRFGRPSYYELPEAPTPTNAQVNWKELLSKTYRPKPYLDQAKVEEWKAMIEKEMGVVTLEGLKNMPDLSQVEAVDHFVAALHEMQGEVYSIDLPKKLTTYLMNELFQFALYRKNGVLPSLDIVSKTSFAGPIPGGFEIYDFDKQEIDLEQINQLKDRKSVNDNVKFNNIPITPEHIQSFTELCIHFDDDNHSSFIDFKSGQQSLLRMYEKEDQRS